jgi:hypothetical protein
MAEEPDPDHMIRFCREALPGMLTEACGVTEAEAVRAATDILSRAEAAARLDLDSRRLLAAPFFEESFWHDPDDASPWMKAFTTLVVRNSYLEELHANGPVNSEDIKVVTTLASGPLSHLLVARRRQPVAPDAADDPFAGLKDEYPRAWACLQALRDSLLVGGGRSGYVIPRVPCPRLPDASEVTEAETDESRESPLPGHATVVFSGIDPRFDQEAIGTLRMAAQGDGLILATSSLSRLSRNSRKLLRVLEFLLAHRAKILTTNYLLTSKEVWVRHRHPVRPDSDHPLVGLHDQAGLRGAHRKTVETYLEIVAEESARGDVSDG